jgi:hypothetical protein
LVVLGPFPGLIAVEGNEEGARVVTQRSGINLQTVGLKACSSIAGTASTVSSALEISGSGSELVVVSDLNKVSICPSFVPIFLCERNRFLDKEID